MNIRKTTRRALSLIAVGLALGATASTTVERRREIRREVERSTGADVPRRFLKDEDPLVRRYALYAVWTRDHRLGERLAAEMKSDADGRVNLMVRDILEPDRDVAKLRSNVPLSQDTSIDHEILKVKSFRPADGKVVLPQKPTCDSVELWFAQKPSAKVRVKVNGTAVYEYDPKRDGARDFRADVTNDVRWDAENAFALVDEKGQPVDIAFTVEVLVCGN